MAQRFNFQFAQAAFFEVNFHVRISRREQPDEPAQIRFVADNQNIFRRRLDFIDFSDKRLGAAARRQFICAGEFFLTLENGGDDSRRLQRARKWAGKNQVEGQFHFAHGPGDLPDSASALGRERAVRVAVKTGRARFNGNPVAQNEKIHRTFYGRAESSGGNVAKNPRLVKSLALRRNQRKRRFHRDHARPAAGNFARLGVRDELVVLAVKRDGDVFVAADAFLDGLGVFLAIQQCLPRINVLGLVKIAVAEKRQALHADAIEDVVAVGDFPGVNQRREFLVVFPKIQGVFAPLAFHDVRVRGDGKSALRVDVRDGLRQIERGRNRRFQIDAEQVRGGFFACSRPC